MGGIGRYATVSLLLPPDVTLGWVDALYDGLLERAAEAGVALVGGNLARSREGIVVDVTLLGDAGRLLLRTGARPGDLRRGHRHARRARPRACASCRRARGSTRTASSSPPGCGRSRRPRRSWRACARSSTRARRSRSPARSPSAASRTRGWTSRTASRPTCSRSARQSGVAAVVDAASLPVDPKAAGLERAGGGDPLELALHGGEDYQLLLAVAPDELGEVRELARVLGADVTAVGTFVEGEPAVRLRDGVGRAAAACRAGTTTSARWAAEGGAACAGSRARARRSSSTSRTARTASPPPSASASSSPSSRSSGIHTGLALGIALAVPPEQGRDPGRRLDQQPLDARAHVQRGHARSAASLLGVSPVSPARARLEPEGPGVLRGARHDAASRCVWPFVVGNLVAGRGRGPSRSCCFARCARRWPAPPVPAPDSGS